jgi:ATP-dependent helicase/nuclease subunit A
MISAAIAIVEAPELAAVWHRPGPAATVWRERAFEVVLDETWVTGVCDRVVIDRGSDGRVVAATVFDFKTDRLPRDVDSRSAATAYSEQITLYRRVVAILLGVPLERVAGEIVFTESRQRVRTG